MRILVAMSGGVDSSVVAGLLREQGHEVVGATLQLYDHGAAVAKRGACCAGQDIHDARRVADRLGIPHYVLDREETRQFMDKVVDLCRFLFPRYQKEGKAYLTVALGCTGGKHRSVAIAEELRKRLAGDQRVQLWDRDIAKE